MLENAEKLRWAFVKRALWSVCTNLVTIEEGRGVKVKLVPINSTILVQEGVEVKVLEHVHVTVVRIGEIHGALEVKL
jgi:hypothetical protein